MKMPEKQGFLGCISVKCVAVCCRNYFYVLVKVYKSV